MSFVEIHGIRRDLSWMKKITSWQKEQQIEKFEKIEKLYYKF